MPYSQRQKQIDTAGAPDVYQYDTLSQRFRAQVVHVLNDAFGETTQSVEYRWGALLSFIGRISGAFDISLEAPRASVARKVQFDKGSVKYIPPVGLHVNKDLCVLYLLNAEDKQALDAIECALHIVTNPDHWNNNAIINIGKEATMSAADAVAEINFFFRDNNLGYQFVEGLLVRVDSEYVHADVVLPALTLLRDRVFNSANDEFRKAHGHFRHGDYKAAIIEAENAFESAIKIIADQRGWTLPTMPTAGPLIDMCFANGLVSDHLDDNKEGVRAMLRGLSVVRNKSGGHGAGITPLDVPMELAAYALHLAAANIVFLVGQHRMLP